MEKNNERTTTETVGARAPRNTTDKEALRLIAAGMEHPPCTEKCDGCGAELKCPDASALPERILCGACFAKEHGLCVRCAAKLEYECDRCGRRVCETRNCSNSARFIETGQPGRGNELLAVLCDPCASMAVAAVHKTVHGPGVK